MPVPQLVWDVIDQQLDLVLNLDSEEITILAKKLAYYDAMLEASGADPLEDPREQAEVDLELEKRRQEILEVYMGLVNQAL